MSSIACLRALLEDQKKKEIELLKELIQVKTVANASDDRYAQFESELSEKQTDLTQAHATINHLQVEVEVLKQNLAQQKNEFLIVQEKCVALQEKTSSLEQQRLQIQSEMSNSSQKQRDLETACEILAESENLLKNESTRAKRDLEALTKLMADVESKHFKETEKLINCTTQLEAENHRLLLKKDRIQSQLSAVQATLDELTEQHHLTLSEKSILEQEVENFRGELGLLKADIQVATAARREAEQKAQRIDKQISSVRCSPPPLHVASRL